MRTIAETAGLISLEAATAKALEAKPDTMIEVELNDRKWPQGWDCEFEIIDANGMGRRRQDQRSTQNQGRLVLNRWF